MKGCHMTKGSLASEGNQLSTCIHDVIFWREVLPISELKIIYLGWNSQNEV